jgi:PPE-repeat protein
MLAAAAAWARLAGELGSAANGYESVVSALSGQEWLGPASESMAAAAARYVAWMGATAAQADQAAARASAAAGAFEQAYAAMVPPPVIAANRSQLASLVAANVFGQNSAAIAATEAAYAQMWGQDAAVMYGYAGRSAAAAAVPAFTAPPPATDPGGLGAQAASAAGGVAGGTHGQLSQLMAAIPQALQGAAFTPGSPAPLAGVLAPLQSVQAPSSTQAISYFELIAKSIVPFNDAIKTILYGLLQFSRNLVIDLDQAAAANAATLSSGAAALPQAGSVGFSAAGPAVSAGIGDAGMVGKLAVPPGWVDAAPQVKMAAAALPGTAPNAAPVVAADIPTGLFADMALASLAGRAIAGSAPRSRPAAVMNGYAQTRLQRLVTELAGTHEVQHWHVDADRLDSLLEELSEQPGVHAVHVNPDGRNGPKPRQRTR